LSHLFDRLIHRAVDRAPFATGHLDEFGISEIDTAAQTATHTARPSPADAIEQPSKSAPDLLDAAFGEAPVINADADTAHPQAGQTRVDHSTTTQQGNVLANAVTERPSEPEKDRTSEKPSQGIVVARDPERGANQPLTRPVPQATERTSVEVDRPEPLEVSADRRPELAKAQPRPRSSHRVAVTDPGSAPKHSSQDTRRGDTQTPADQPTEVNVTIGRVEVLAPPPSQPTFLPSRSQPASSVHLTLTDYMARKKPHEQ